MVEMHILEPVLKCFACHWYKYLTVPTESVLIPDVCFIAAFRVPCSQAPFIVWLAQR